MNKAEDKAAMSDTLKKYLNFDLLIEKDSYNNQYRVSVPSAPVGKLDDPIYIPFPVEQKALDSLHQILEQFGESLFDTVFSSKVRELYRRSLNLAEANEAILRLRLRISSPELASLPWEYLFDPELGDFVCLSPTLIVRYIVRQGQALARQPVTPPLKILGVIATPNRLPAMMVGKKRIERQLGKLIRLIGKFCGKPIGGGKMSKLDLRCSA